MIRGVVNARHETVVRLRVRGPGGVESGGLSMELVLLPSPFAAASRVGEVVPVGEDVGSLVGRWRRPLQVDESLRGE